MGRPKYRRTIQSGGFTQAQIDEWHGNLPEPETPPPSLEERRKISGLPEMLTEAPVLISSLEKMTKVQLESLGRQHGIELDRRKSKKSSSRNYEGLTRRLSKGITFTWIHNATD